MPKKKIKFYEDLEKTLQVYPELDPEEIPVGIKELLTEGSTVTGEGSSLTLDSDILKIKDLQLLGNTEQSSTIGKNLLNLSNIANFGGITNTINADGTLTSTGLPTGNWQVYLTNNITDDLEDGETYTISQTQASRKMYIQVNEINKSDSTVHQRYYLTSNANQSFSVNKTLYNYTIAIQSGDKTYWENTSQTVTQYYQLEKGSSATAFEKFTYGASPNPNYPQEVHCATGNQIIQRCGKNLCGIKNVATANYKGVNVTLQDGYILLNGTVNEESGVINIDNSLENVLLNKTTYRLTLFVESGTIANGNVRFYIKDNDTEINSVSNVSLTETKTLNYNQTTNRIGLYLNNGVSFNNYKVKLLLTYGLDVQSTYESFVSVAQFPISLGNIELNKIGKYQDKIYKQNDKWYLEKNIGKIVLNGTTDSFNIYNHYNDFERVGINADNLKMSAWSTIQNQDYIYCDKLSNTGSISNPQVNTILSWNGENRIFMFFTPNTFNSLVEANNYLTTHNTTIYYVYLTPITTEITNATLISQLENIELNSGQNNIYVLSENDNLPVFLNIEAYTNVIDILDLKADKDDLKNMGDGVPTGSLIGWNGDDSEIPGGYEITGLNNILYFDTVADMKSADLKEGDMAVTKGYYSANDGGGARYNIVLSTAKYKETLDNNLKAELNEDKVYPEMFGAYGDGTHNDQVAFDNLISYYNEMNLHKKTYKITSLHFEKDFIINGNDATIIDSNSVNNTIEMTTASDNKILKIFNLTIDASHSNVGIYINQNKLFGQYITVQNAITKNIHIIKTGSHGLCEIDNIKCENSPIGIHLQASDCAISNYEGHNCITHLKNNGGLTHINKFHGWNFNSSGQNVITGSTLIDTTSSIVGNDIYIDTLENGIKLPSDSQYISIVLQNVAYFINKSSYPATQQHPTLLNNLDNYTGWCKIDGLFLDDNGWKDSNNEYPSIISDNFNPAKVIITNVANNGFVVNRFKPYEYNNDIQTTSYTENLVTYVSAGYRKIKSYGFDIHAYIRGTVLTSIPASVEMMNITLTGQNLEYTNRKTRVSAKFIESGNTTNTAYDLTAYIDDDHILHVINSTSINLGSTSHLGAVHVYIDDYNQN